MTFARARCRSDRREKSGKRSVYTPLPQTGVILDVDIVNGLLILTVATMVTNLPFGYWREGVRRFSPAWFAAVHAAVPIVVALRLMLGVEWRLATLPLLLIAYFAGQLLGAHWRRRMKSRASEDAPGNHTA